MRDKWDRIYRERGEGLPQAVAVLEDNLHLLPDSGRALEIACGLGGNALLLAQQGLVTDAWDISAVAIERLSALAREHGLPLTGAVRDILHQPPEVAVYDVVVVSHFLDRSLCPYLIRALRPGGLLFYQTFTREAISAGGPSNPEFRLAENELLVLFRELRLVLYREEGTLGDVSRGFRDEAMLVGVRRGGG
ncbi:MAG: class I SAM-dependent methyltransferase [Gammaproteobacteria bacterium]